MIRERQRAAKPVEPGGIVGLYVWDYAGHMQVMRHFFDVATALDLRASEFDDGVKAPISRPDPLANLFSQAGLRNVAVHAIDIPTAFESFDGYWSPFFFFFFSAPKYCMSLTEKHASSLTMLYEGAFRRDRMGKSCSRRGLGRSKDGWPAEDVLAAPESQDASDSFRIVCSGAGKRQSASGSHATRSGRCPDTTSATC